MTFFDTNVLFDILYADERWSDWSTQALIGSGSRRVLAPVVYAELAGRYPARADLDEDLQLLGLVVVEPSRAALFAAGQAHRAYRQRGGTRERVLADFLIGAQASEEGAVLVTRDAARYRTAFPDLVLVSP